MNPFPVAFSLLAGKRFTLLAFVILIAFSTALGVAISAQERALRQGSARAADKFDLVIGAPGSQYDLVLASVYLRIAALELVSPETFDAVMNDDRVEWAAPLAFGDSAEGYPIIGTTAQLVNHLSGELAEGRNFQEDAEAVVGADVIFDLGDEVDTVHGLPGLEAEFHAHELRVVGRMAPTGTPWDRAIIVPVEQVWEVHGLPNGHAPPTEEEHDPDHADLAEEATPDADNHEHHDEHHPHALGPPFDLNHLSGVPAIVVKPAGIAEAYALRSAYRSETSQALFPAEILVQLYQLMGDARQIMSLLVTATQALVVAASLAGLLVVLQLYTRRFAILRALGAGRLYVVAVAWVYMTTLVGTGALLGLALGAGTASLLSSYLSSLGGFRISASIGVGEWALVGWLALGAAVLAVVPALALFRRPLAEALR